jgi:hypothetical protein
VKISPGIRFALHVYTAISRDGLVACVSFTMVRFLLPRLTVSERENVLCGAHVDTSAAARDSLDSAVLVEMLWLLTRIE